MIQSSLSHSSLKTEEIDAQLNALVRFEERHKEEAGVSKIEDESAAETSAGAGELVPVPVPLSQSCCCGVAAIVSRVPVRTMPEEIVVLRCKQCSFFQTHLSKKSIRYNCKVCGEKQSISRVYFKGTGAECRRTCQHLNTAVPSDGDSEDVDRELDRYQDRVHRLRMQSLERRPASPADPDQQDSDEMLGNEEDFESEDQTDTPSDSPDTTDGHRDEGFEERNLLRDDHNDNEEKQNSSFTAVTSSSAASLAAVSCVIADDSSPPVSKKSKYSLF